jgi:hypothetical protein
MSSKGVTIALLFGAAGLLVGWDLWLYYHEPTSMISKVVLDTARQHPVLPFLLGVLSGHLFWPQKVVSDTCCEQKGE